ncbi:MAG: patatin-like phospholipase family protein [Anaerolineae bacterium]|jgi:hypothetical protein|nr:patatin-like phospholipase family protein [Anaerolineae bacterium]
MLDWNPQGKKTILSIDGGGMRGVITLAMLAELEAQTGRPAWDMFDLVAGTSTGAIIAAGLAVKMSAAQILAVYRDELPRLFGTQDVFFWLRWLFAHRLRHLYPLEPFRLALQKLVEGKKMRDLTDPIVLFTVKDVRTSSTYFIVSAGRGAAAFADWPVAGAVAASGAAPIFFPPVAGNLIDGGVGVYGNPCLAAAIEAMEYIGAAAGFVDGRVIHLSLGTGYPPLTFADGAAGRFWLKDWIEYIVGENLDDSGLQQVFTTRAIYRHRMDFRRYNPLLTRDNIEKTLELPNTAWIDPARLGLDSRRPTEIHLMEQIGQAYARRLDWTAPDVMPWDTVGGHPAPDKAMMQIDWAQTPYR